MNTLQGRALRHLSICFPLLAALTACGGGGSSPPPSYTLGGTVTGLQGTVVLQTGDGGQLSVTADGSFTFPTSVTGGSGYTVSVLTQPVNETCAVAGASGTANSNVTSIAVTCTLNAYAVGGTATGLLNPVVLQDGGTDNLTVNADGTFTFPTKIQIGSPYAVTVFTQSVGQFCAVTNGSGTMGTSQVTNIALTCAPRYSVGGTVSGLTVSGLVLANDSATLNIDAGASTFTFATALTPGSAYNVTIKTTPLGFSCVLANGTGTANANVQNVAITCTPLSYSLGGSIQGLNSKGLVLANGADRVTVALDSSQFTMPTPVAYTSSYATTIATQPDGLTCTIAGGAGTMPAANLSTVAISCDLEWTWKSGSPTANPPGFFANKGTPDVANVPSALAYSATWVDRAGKLWLFGGLASEYGTTPYADNLWRYDPASGEWTWVTGSGPAQDASGVYGTLGVETATNSPGARAYAVSWTDNSGNLWLFGGFGFDGAGGNGTLNDLWRFNPATGRWTWMGGSNAINAASVYGTQGTPNAGNHPGARSSGVAWTDASGVAWLFGGIGQMGELNDLWRYDPATGIWAWMSGSNTGGAASVYGTQGVPDAANVPSARIYSMASSDAEGNLWLFGGDDTDSLNDLWKFNTATNQWTWVSGKNGGGGTATYGTLGVDTPGSVPGARTSALIWTGNAGDLWLLGGFGLDSAGSGGFLNDLWRFDTASGHWIWMSGSNMSQVAGVYGTLGVPSAGNIPPVRDYAMGWKDGSGRFWVMGGQVWLPNSAGGYFNDLWEF